MTIAIFSPTDVAYSETFIEAHKLYLKQEVLFYYGIGDKIQLEGADSLEPKKKLSTFNKIKNKIGGKPKQHWTLNVIDSLKHYKPDVLLVEYGTHAHRLLPVLKKVNIPFVVHFHGYDASVKSVIESCGFYKEVFKRANTIIAVSNKMKKMLNTLGCPENKLVYNTYGPRPKFGEITPNFNKLQFIAVGRFTEKKAPHLTLLSFKSVLDYYPKAKLIMAGKGELLEVCKELARHYHILDSVSFPGIISPEQFRNYLKESLAFVQHSVTASNGDMEGTPVAILEASISGIPVIATKHAGIPDVILDGETGLLCEERDVVGMTDNMLKVLKNIDFAKQLGQAGKVYISEHYSLRDHIKVLQDLLVSVVMNNKKKLIE
ncbi:glycosyl transferase family 1 [Flavobacteriaceae bacterium LYZ1037]|nr:glycosyl transferase family 1 [Flavobacteriaceae bacterium LYZ1037]